MNGHITAMGTSPMFNNDRSARPMRTFRKGEAEQIVSQDVNRRDPEWAPTLGLDLAIARARTEMGEDRWAELNREWEA